MTIIILNYTSRSVHDASRSVIDASRSVIDDLSDAPNRGVTFTINVMIITCL